MSTLFRQPAVVFVQAPIDFNQYLGIQRAGIACLKLPQQRVREYAAVWRQRAAALVPVLRQFGWQLPEPKACKCHAPCLHNPSTISALSAVRVMTLWPEPINRVQSHHSTDLADYSSAVNYDCSKSAHYPVVQQEGQCMCRKAWVRSSRV